MLKITSPRNTIVLPDGKSLGETTLKVFTDANMPVKRSHPRDDLARIIGCPGFSLVVFARADQVAWLVQQGYMAAGITGFDQVIEGAADVKICTQLSYSRVTNGGISCVVFTHDSYPVRTLAQLREECEREAITIETEYERETGEFLESKGIKARVRKCTGKAEMLVRIGVAQFGATISETGTSLEKNGCRPLRDEMNERIATVFESSTVLIANKEMYKADPEFRAHVDFLGRLLQGVLDARGNVYLAMNAPAEKVSAICDVLPALKKPTVQPLADLAFCSVASVVPIDQLNLLKMKLIELGATGIIESDLKSVM